MKISKCYSELIKLPTFQERLEYLYIGNRVCEETFGSNRYINQRFYKSKEWARIRDSIITRDLGRDLAFDGCDLATILIHHINPITQEDIVNRNPKVTDPENLICTSHNTHNYIHFGTSLQPNAFVERKPNDTCPWKRR